MPRFGHGKYIYICSLLPREFPHTVLFSDDGGGNNLGASKVTKSEYTVSSYSRLFLAPHGILLFLDEHSVGVPLGHQPPGQVVGCSVSLSAGIHITLEVVKLLL